MSFPARYRIKILLVLSIAIACMCMPCVTALANASEGAAADSNAPAQASPMDGGVSPDFAVAEKGANAGIAGQRDDANQQGAASPANRADGQRLTSDDQGSTSSAASSDKSGDSAKPQVPAEKEEPALKPVKTGWYEKDKDVWYYFTSLDSGPKTGWLYTGGAWYWLDPADDGKMASNAWVDDGGKRYYVTASGAMKTGWHKDGTRDGKDVWYWLDASGARHVGWALVGGTWYWLDPADDGIMKTGKYKAGSAWYVSDASGAMYANGWAPLGSDWYYASGSGALMSGWVSAGGAWYYLDPKDGNVMLHDCIETIDGSRFSFAHSGAMHANCQIKLEDGKCGYAASSGAITQIGVFRDGKVVLQDAKGNPLKRGWHALAGKWFYSEDDAGSMHTGWLQDGGRWYWLESDGAMATSRWVDGGKYYVGADGVWAPVNIIQDIRWQLSHGSKPAQYQKYIVLHDTEGGGSPQGVIDGWASNGQRVAAHFVVGKDGTVVQCVPMDNIAHHAGYGNRGYNAQFGVPEDGRDDKRGTSSYDYGMNSYSIGIELVHGGWSGESYPEAQLDALDRLIAYIDSYYGFQSTIIDHKMWAYGNSDTSAEFAGYLANYRSNRTHR